MNFEHSEDRRMLADTLARALADTPVEARNAAAYGEEGHVASSWKQLVELGIMGVLFAEEHGGFGGSGFDIMVVFGAIGRALSVEPLLGTLMVGRALAAAGGQEDTRARVVSGEAIAAFAHDDGTDPVRAMPDGDGWTLTGAKAVVQQAQVADLFAVTAGDDVFLVPAGAPGLSIRSYALIDGGAGGEVTFANTPAARLGGADVRDAAVEAGLLALSAESLGAMDYVKDATIGYLRDRKQFGVPIGKFQALQHRMATVLLEVEQARSAVINAAAAFDGDDPHARARALAAAKYTIGRTGTLVAEEAVQMHGGIGMTWEYAVSHYAKRLVMIDHQLGDEDFHLQRYVELGRG